MDSFEKKLDENLRAYLREAERIAEEENLEYGERDLEELGQGPVSAEKNKEIAGSLSGVLKKLEDIEGTKKESKKKVQKILKRVKSDFF